MDLKNELNYFKSSNNKEKFVLDELVENMLINIGSVDSELRDELIYTCFSILILEGYLSNNHLKKILNVALDNNHLFLKIGEKDTDTIFTRSFSILLIPLILMANRKNGFLTKNEILEIKEKILLYLYLEKDYRGYVSNKGWAHGIAHAADALCEIAKCNCTSNVQLELLEAIRDIICTKETVYTNLEDERLVNAVVIILKNEIIAIHDIKQWINSFCKWEKSEEWHKEYKVLSNVKNFLASLYFRLDLEKGMEDIKLSIKSELTSLVKGYL